MGKHKIVNLKNIHVGEVHTQVMFTCLHVTCTMYIIVSSCLATKVFIGNLPAMGRGWVIIK